MPSGERSQVWYPEIVAMLRGQWRSDLSWQSLVELRDLLQKKLEDLRETRGIVPPVFRCPSCGAVGPAKPPVISIRAMLISVQRFGIDTAEVVERREHEWAKYRSQRKLDLYGRPSDGKKSELHGHVIDSDNHDGRLASMRLKLSVGRGRPR